MVSRFLKYFALIIALAYAVPAQATPIIYGNLQVQNNLSEFISNGTAYLARAALNTVGYVQSIDTNGISNLVNFPTAGLVNGQVVYVGGYVNEGDAPEVSYAYSTAACTINSGIGIPFTNSGGVLTGTLGDSGSQISSAISGCWNLTPNKQIDFRNFGAQGDTGADVATGPMAYVGTSAGNAALTGNAAAMTNTFNYASSLSSAITGGQTMTDVTGGGEQYVVNYPSYESAPLVYFHDFTMLAGSSTYLSCAINQYVGMLNITTSTVRAADRITVDSNYMPINSIEVQANGTAKYSSMNARHWQGPCATIVTPAYATITGGSNIITFSPALTAGTITTHMIMRGNQAYGIPDRTVVMDVNPGGSPSAPITSIVISKPSLLGQTVPSFNATFAPGTLSGQGLNNQGVGTLTTYNLMQVTSNTVNTGILAVGQVISGGTGVTIPGGTTITGGYGNTPGTYTISNAITGTGTGMTAAAITGTGISGSVATNVALTFNIDPNGLTLGGNNKNTGDTFADSTSSEYINNDNDVPINSLRYGFDLACYNISNLSTNNDCNNINLNQYQLISGVAPMYVDKYAGGFTLSNGSIFQGAFNINELNYPSILIGPDSGEDNIDSYDTNAPVYSFNTDGAKEIFSMRRAKLQSSGNTSFVPSAVLDLYVGTAGTPGGSYSVDPIGMATASGVKNLIEYGPNYPMSPDLNQWDFSSSTLMNGAWLNGTIDGSVLGGTSYVNITGANRVQLTGSATAPVVGIDICNSSLDMCGFASNAGVSNKVITFDNAGITMTVPLTDTSAALTNPVITNGTIDGTVLGGTSYVNITGTNRIQFSGSSTQPTIGMSLCNSLADLCTYNGSKEIDLSPTQMNMLVPISPSTTGGLIGTTLGDNANAGSVGEYITASLAQGAAVSLSSGTATQIVSFTLTPGDWDVWGTAAINPAGTTVVSLIKAGINSSVAIPAQPTQGALVQLPYSETGNPVVFSLGMTRIDVSVSTVEYLVINCSFTTSTNAGYGAIFARRVR